MKRLVRLVLLALLAGLLLLGLYVLSRPLRHEAAWRVQPHHQGFVKEALARAARASGTSEQEYRRKRRPRVRERGRETCVTLAIRWSHEGGSYIACFDTRDGSVISETQVGWPFGAIRLSDRLAEWVW